MLIDHLEGLWQGLLDFTAQLVIPDWGALIALLPLFVLLGVVGPIVTLLVLAWLIYIVRRPRPKVAFESGPYAAPLDESGNPIFPAGEPYCPIDGLVYPFETTRCDVEGHPLAVVCPKCGLGRSAEIDTCGNCGLVLRIAPRSRALRPAGPPPGGAAVA